MRFEVKAVGAGGRILRLVLDAIDREDAATQVAGRGNRILTVTPARWWQDWPPQGRRTRLPLALFCQELLALLESGLGLVEAIDTLAEKEAQPDTRRVLERMATRLREGLTLSASLERAGDEFPPLFVATVRASEVTGALPEALSRYLRYQGQVDAVRRHAASALVYPAVLAAVGALVAVFLLVYVVPRFSQVYADTGAELPLTSRMLVTWGRLLADHPLLSAATSLAAIGCGLWLMRQPGVRRWMLACAWRLPALGERLRLFYLARLYRSLGMLLRGGMPVANALALAGGVLEPGLRVRLDQAAKRIREGYPISHAMQDHGLASPVAQRMLLVGERSGAMGDMMERIAAFYEDDTARWVDRFTRLFEPVLMVAIGGVIGFIVVLMYMPIFDLAGSLG